MDGCVSYTEHVILQTWEITNVFECVKSILSYFIYSPVLFPLHFVLYCVIYAIKTVNEYKQLHQCICTVFPEVTNLLETESLYK